MNFQGLYCELLFVHRIEDVSIRCLDIQADVAKAIKSSAKKLHSSLDKSSNVSYADYYRGVKSKCYVYDLADDTPNDVQRLLAGEKFDKFRFGSENFSYQCTRLSIDGELKLAAFKVFTKRQTISPDRYMYIFKGDQYKLVSNPMLKLPADWDFMVIGQKAYISKPNNFEEIMQLEELYRRSYDDIRELLDSSEISLFDSEKVLETLSRKRILRRLHFAKVGGTLIEPTFDRAKKVIQEYDASGLQIKDQDGEEKLAVIDYRKIWDFVRLLDDSYLTSEFTDQNYKADKKKGV